MRRRSLTAAAALAGALVVGQAAGLAAQRGRPLFEWSGRVDGEVVLIMRGDRLWPEAAPGNLLAPTHFQVQDRLPREDGVVRVRVESGRGLVEVAQQPSRVNRYTTRIRIRDDAPGAGVYRLVAFWRPFRGRDYAGADDRDRDVAGPGERGRAVGHEVENPGMARGHEPEHHDVVVPGRGDEHGPPVVEAHGRLHWSGWVDDHVDVRVRGREAETVTVSGTEIPGVRADLNGWLPVRRATFVSVIKREGRGTIMVLEQPSPANDFTAVVRVRDPRAGRGHYTFDLTW